jgi:hypothetical protein
LLGLAVYMEDGNQMRAVLATAVVWTLGRWAFWGGYHLGSTWRVLGAPSMLLGQLVLGYVGLRVGLDVAATAGAWAVLVAFLLFEAPAVLEDCGQAEDGLKGEEMRLGNAVAGGLLAFGVLTLSASVSAQAASEGPSSATVAMRWQWLNPEINAFTFRDTDRCSSRARRPLGRRLGPAATDPWQMPAIAFGGETRGYDRFAEDTFTNALLVVRDGRIVFEDYRNRSSAATRFISFSMAKTITALLVGIALDQGKIASLDDPVTRYLPELAGTGYDGATIRQVMQMRSASIIRSATTSARTRASPRDCTSRRSCSTACASPTAPARPGAPTRPAAHSTTRRSIRS